MSLLLVPHSQADAEHSHRSTYGSHAPLWPALAAVWQVEAARLASDDKDSIPAVLALAALLLSLCTQSPDSQQHAVCVPCPSPRPKQR